MEVVVERDEMLDGITRWSPNGAPHGMASAEKGIYVSFSDLPVLIACVRADERERAAGRVEGLSPFFAPGPWITRDLKPCVRVDQTLAAIREGGA